MKILFIFSIVILPLFAQALINGSAAETEEYVPVVFMRTEAVEKDGSSAPSFCNATFLSDRLLITAAHCVVQSIALRKTEIIIDIGEYVYNKKNGNRIGYLVREKVTDPKATFKVLDSVENRLARKGVNTDLGLTDDIALIYLSTPVKVEKPVLTFAQKASRSQAGAFISRINQYLPEIVTVNPIAEMSTSDTRRRAVLNQVSTSGYGSNVHLESKSTARVEPGDSGAPLFMRESGKLFLVGITKGRGETFFTNWDVYTWIGDKACEIGAKLPLSNDEKGTLCH
ncbi:MAG: hypothetical protein BroJett040_24370 [Oligoflexia bacterium]|nr:MAG: hypothetical protein BroJett040_24370 [Oligoflexia bacterium]